MKKIFIKIVNFFKNLFKKNKKENSVIVESESLEKNTPPIVTPQKTEPDLTGKLGVIESFLWKPISENTHEPVVLVCADDVPTNELFIEIFNKNNNIMRSVNTKSFSRGNILPNRKFARISFRLDVKMSQFEKAQPIKIKFFQMINGVKTYLPLKNRKQNYVTITNVQKRVEWR